MEFVKKYEKYIYIASAVVAFIFAAFTSTVDILNGKAIVSGFKYVFEADGAGFSRFLMFLALVAPLGAIYFAVAKPVSQWGKNIFYCFVAAALLMLITLAALPAHCSLAFGGWAFIILSVAAAAIAFNMAKLR